MHQLNRKRIPTNSQSDLHDNSLLIISNSEFIPKPKIHPPLLAIFDLDDTLITTKSQQRFDKDADDWKFADPSVPDKLKSLAKSGFLILIVTNQLGISKGVTTVDQERLRIESVLKSLEVPAIALAAIKDDAYRKPFISAYEYIVKEILLENSLFINAKENGNLKSPENFLQKSKKSTKQKNFEAASKNFNERKKEALKETNDNSVKKKLSKKVLATAQNKNWPVQFLVDFSQSDHFGLGANIHRSSFFCGDAAGRNDLERTDFSDSDLLFAINIKINFCLPEQLFFNRKFANLAQIPSFKFTNLLAENHRDFFDLHLKEVVSKSENASAVIILTGPPSCGKTTFVNSYFPDFEVISYVF